MSDAKAELKMLLEDPVLIYGACRGVKRIIFNLKVLNVKIYADYYHDDKEVLCGLIIKGDPNYKIEFLMSKLYAYKL